MKSIFLLMFSWVIDPVAFELGPFSVRWYGIIIGCGILIAYKMFSQQVKEHGLDLEWATDVMFWSILLGFVGARLYYVLFRWDYYQAHPDQIIQVWQGGLAIYGGVLVGGLTAYLLTKRAQISARLMGDMAAPALMVAQAIGRWGNFVNQEAHGGPIQRSLLAAWHLPEFVIEQMKIEGVYYHPTFLYESSWNIMGLILLFICRSKFKGYKQGDTMAFYLIWYGIGRAIIEGLRTDSLYWGPIRVSQGLSIVLVGIGFTLMIVNHRRQTKEFN
ncbi:prolipoprotein diacylglyceryl transferase [Vaginisenegalia massiliensis]|uniref:prolipoprotein diacylglyceryl transferase n=1 Tax=Vaginisenegalia massiliensis TaxID=2058294 RepID=UPI001F14F925|nr:prolipoprotein diacylglyceryl transferase [Vaginisenegalia massiliensis]